MREAAKLLKLEPYLDRKPLNLSGGQQQRTAIARALVKRADLVLLDEPLANLDYKLREELREELPRVFAASGAIFVYATTEPTEALLLGGNTATLFQGRVTQFGPTPQVYRQPARSHHGAGLLRSAAQHPAGSHQTGGSATLSTGGQIRAVGAFAAVPDGDYTVGFRAHHLMPGTAAPPTRSPSRPPSPSPRSPARRAIVHLDAGEHRFVALVPGVRRLEPGSAVTAYSRPAAPLPLRCGRPPRGRRSRPEGGLRRDRWPASRSIISPTPTGPIRAGPQDYALKEINHVWSQGGAYALLGPSGCGKTTLLNIISGLVRPTRGRILFDDRDVTDLPTEARNIAQVFQFPVVYDTMTVRENLAFPLKNRHVPRDRTAAAGGGDRRAFSISPACSTARRATSRPT